MEGGGAPRYREIRAYVDNISRLRSRRGLLPASWEKWRIIHICSLPAHQLVADFLFDIAPHHIQLPEHDEMQRLSSELRYPDGEVKQVILYIDGYIARIQRPDHAGNAYFCGRHGKSCDSLNTQYVTDQFGQVRHIITGLPGSTHDKTATEWSRTFMDFLDNLPDGYITIGDPAYRNLHRNVGHRFMGHGLTEEQQQFNDDITRLRQVVERTIGATQLKWRMAQMKENRLAAKGGIIFASKLIVSMAVLHNRYTNYL